MRYALGLAFLLIAVITTFLVAGWIQENYVSLSSPEQPSGPFHNPGYRQKAEHAVGQFSKLSAGERAALLKNLHQNIVSVERWLDSLRGTGFSVLCLGENHEDATRQFLARTLFSESPAKGATSREPGTNPFTVTSGAIFVMVAATSFSLARCTARIDLNGCTDGSAALRRAVSLTR